MRAALIFERGMAEAHQVARPEAITERDLDDAPFGDKEGAPAPMPNHLSFLYGPSTDALISFLGPILPLSRVLGFLTVLPDLSIYRAHRDFATTAQWYVAPLRRFFRAYKVGNNGDGTSTSAKDEPRGGGGPLVGRQRALEQESGDRLGWCPETGFFKASAGNSQLPPVTLQADELAMVKAWIGRLHEGATVQQPLAQLGLEESPPTNPRPEDRPSERDPSRGPLVLAHWQQRRWVTFAVAAAGGVVIAMASAVALAGLRWAQRQCGRLAIVRTEQASFVF